MTKQKCLPGRGGICGIGRVSLARENEAWGQECHFSSVEGWGSALFLAALIAAVLVNVPSIGFRKMKSNGSGRRN